MRVRNKPWAEDYIKQHDGIVVLEPSQNKGKWEQEFQHTNRPIHLEIGSGRGGFIQGMGTKNPNINFIGMELQKNVIVSAIDRVKEAEVENVRLLHENADQLSDIFEENELETIYLNFSDPWPKNRHEKRRLTHQSFLSQYQQILKPNGKIVMKTDNQHLFEYSLVSFSQFGLLLEEVTLDLHATGDPTNVMTEYEEKFTKKGMPIYRCIISNHK